MRTLQANAFQLPPDDKSGGHVFAVKGVTVKEFQVCRLSLFFSKGNVYRLGYFSEYELQFATRIQSHCRLGRQTTRLVDARGQEQRGYTTKRHTRSAFHVIIVLTLISMQEASTKSSLRPIAVCDAYSASSTTDKGDWFSVLGTITKVKGEEALYKVTFFPHAQNQISFAGLW